MNFQPVGLWLLETGQSLISQPVFEFFTHLHPLPASLRGWVLFFFFALRFRGRGGEVPSMVNTLGIDSYQKRLVGP